MARHGSLDDERNETIQAAVAVAARACPAPHADIKVNEVHAAFWRSLIAKGKFDEYACLPFVTPSPLPEEDGA